MLKIDLNNFNFNVNNKEDFINNLLDIIKCANDVDKVYLRLHRYLVNNMDNHQLTPGEIDEICESVFDELCKQNNIEKDEIKSNNPKRDKNLEKQLEMAFEMGMNFILVKQGIMESSTMPNNSKDALEYMYQFIIDKNIDKECLACGRYVSGSCRGVVDRKRDKITSGNRCGAFFNKNKDVDN